MSLDEKKINVGILDVIAYFWSHIKTKKYQFFMLLIVTVSINIIGLLMPLYYKSIIDIVTNSTLTKDELFIRLMGVFKYMALTSISLFLGWRVFDLLLPRFETSLMMKVALECFGYVQRHSYRFFTNNFSGSLVKKINRMVDSIEGSIDTLLFDLTRLVISFAFVSIVLARQNIYLGGLFLVWILLFATATYFLNKNRLPYWQEAMKEDSVISGKLADSISNSFNISIFGKFRFEYDKFMHDLDKRRKIIMRSWVKQNINFGMLGLISVCIEIVIVYMAIRLWSQDMITIGTFVLLITYQMIISGNLFSMTHIFRRFNTLIGNASEMLEVLKTPHEIQDIDGAKDMDVSQGKIEFNDVTFNYNEGVKVFKDFSLTINPGEKVAFVGHSGSGKSTIIKLIFRFMDLNSGSIKIDGQDISKVTQDTLRSSLSLVPQEPILFHRSLLENISYACPDASYEEIINVSKLAHCHEFIEGFKEGYDTLVGERGIKLSGGEKQRVAIARAILADTKILVLDEATSSLDSESEKFIQDAIENVLGKRTTIVVAHRLSTVMKMDRIIVLDDGEIVEEGTHSELIAKEGGAYKRLWDIQSGGFIS